MQCVKCGDENPIDIEAQVSFRCVSCDAFHCRGQNGKLGYRTDCECSVCRPHINRGWVGPSHQTWCGERAEKISCFSGEDHAIKVLFAQKRAISPCKRCIKALAEKMLSCI